MADSKGPNIPSWQQSQAQEEAAPETSHYQKADATDVTLDQARKFLRDESVRNSSIEKKTEFLKNKGLDDTQVQTLLEETEQDTQASNPPPTTNKSAPGERDTEQASRTDKETEMAVPTASSATSDSPPIITYPEFLTTSPRPPPLITPSRLANILTISGSVWTLLYGTARFVVGPMVETLNDARTDYYEHVNGKLEKLVEKLEGAVSEVPYKNGKPLKSKQEIAYEDNESVFSDPTELFHRDIGTQTSPVMMAEDPATPGNTSSQPDKTVDSQLRRLTAVRASVREINDIRIRQADESANLNAVLREIRDEVDKLGAPPLTDFSSYHTGLGYGRSAEPDDEVKKAKDAIRSVKGMFLSTRSFPTTAAR
ncbi:peroxisomal membrane anchor protein conserved region-domain-containing protein [Hypoxylon crocopeplum]|nr:peroxisomal membrane anchor protein conserved region-domain-containing protein [Hypoxylon crocopeplum]